MTLTVATQPKQPEAVQLEAEDARAAMPAAYAISNSLTLSIAAGPDSVRRALRRHELRGRCVRALSALGLEDQVTVLSRRLMWHPARSGGHVNITVEHRVEAAEDGASYLSVTTRFAPSSEDASDRLHEAWSVLGPLSRTLVERAARSVKTAAEDKEDGFHDSDGAIAHWHAA